MIRCVIISEPFVDIGGGKMLASEAAYKKFKEANTGAESDQF